MIFFKDLVNSDPALHKIIMMGIYNVLYTSSYILYVRGILYLSPVEMGLLQDTHLQRNQKGGIYSFLVV